MEFAEVLRRRRMVRNYESRPVPMDVRDRILAAGLRAPSAGFSQGWGFLVLETEDDRIRFWEHADNEPVSPDDPWGLGLRRAPLVVVPFAHKQTYLDRYQEPDKAQFGLVEEAWPIPYWFVDAGMAALLMLLSAVDAGLGACFFGLVPDDQQVRQAFGVPQGYQAVGALTIGYPAPDVPSPSLQRGHRALDEVLHFGRWTA
jgi:nitroreductase